MKPDVFGDLRDWGRILAVLRLLEEKGKLDEVQQGLTRLLRYRENWQLREKALLSARRVDSPSESLLFAVLDVICDRTSYVDARILAAQTFAQLATRALAESVDGEAMKRAIKVRLSALLEKPEPPVLSDVVQKTIRAVDRVDVQVQAPAAQGEKVWS